MKIPHQSGLWAASLLAICAGLSVSQNAYAACTVTGAPPGTDGTVNCTGTYTLPAPIAFTTANNLSINLGTDGNPATISYLAATPISLTLTGAAGTAGTLDTGNAGTPSAIIGGTSGVSVTSTAGANILIGQSSVGGAGLNANITGQSAQGILASSTGTGSIFIHMASGTTVTGSSNGIEASVAAGSLNIIFDGNVVTQTPGAYWDVQASSTGTGNITIGGSGNAASGGIRANSTGTGSITIQGSGNTTDLVGPGILAQISNAANTSAIQISRGGSITGSSDGIAATNAGSGGITITTAGAVYGTSGYGINASSTTGLTTVNVGAGSTIGGGSGSINLLGTGVINNSGTVNGLVTGSAVTFNNAGVLNISSASASNVQSFNTFNGQGGTVVVNVNPSAGTADLIRTTNLSGTTYVLANTIGGSNVITTPINVITASNVAAGTVVAPLYNGLFNYTIQSSADAAVAGQTDYKLSSSLNISAAAGVPQTINTVVTALETGFFQNSSALTSDPANPSPNQINGGPWIKVGTGADTTWGTASGGPAGAVTTAATKASTTFSGFQTGVDLGVANVQNMGWNTHLGVTAGQVDLNVNDLIDSSISNQTKVSYVGLYGVVNGHGFFADAQIRGDFYDMHINNPTAGLGNTPLSGSAFAFNTSAGYHFALPQSWFIEPSVAFLYNRLSVDTLSYGVLGSQTFGAVLSEIGRFGLRAGTTYVFDKVGVAVSPFVVGSVWREFAGSSTSHYIAPGGALDVPLQVSRVGTFGQMSLGVSAQILNTGFVGFARGDYRFGENIQGYAAVAGLRYMF